MALLQAKDLTHIAKVRDTIYRPSKARQILPTDNSVPEWARRIEKSLVSLSGEDPVLISSGNHKDLPTVDVDKTETYQVIYKFGMALHYTDDEVTEAEQAGLNLPSVQIKGNAGIAERFVEKCAAGDYQTSLSIPGLLTNSAVTIATASTKTGGGTTWEKGTLEEIIDEIAQELQAVRTATYEAMSATQMVLPETCYNILERRRDHLNMSALAIIRREFPSVKFVSWHKCNLANAGGTGGRAVTMAEGEEVARLVIPVEMTEGTAMREAFGWMIPQYLKIAGCIMETPSAVRYLDGVS